ncbi:AAA family ATPase [Actinorugispora endophytica]|uniref:AAA domain-containing protein n=1 Tax=Actinorugispora endophytica TaxID=1605990 RepID=A0A4R6V9H0_9ACTN|nr:AAA family ATPase [Actinorugispora endophytica]TDQ53108.1 AAA domain-containing protein [Actinorugispora endophytica]
MRINRLDLTAFGPFSGLSLPLDAPGVHVVHGPNEAGKSTALEALNQLFYGIDLRSRYGFVHDITALRLGAEITDGDGAVLDFVRHKRRKNDLTGPDGTPLDEDRLLGFLHGITKDVFTNTFALTLAELKQGGESLLKGEGDIGQALFSARSSQDLASVLDRLEDRRRELFLLRGQNPGINRALGEYRRLDRTVRERQTLPAEFVKLRTAVEAAEKRFAELGDRLRAERDEQGRLNRLASALPLLRTRALARESLAALTAEGPLAADDATERLHGLEQKAVLARQKRRQAEDDLQAQKDELGALHVDERLTGAARSVSALVKSAAKVESADNDLAALSREAADARAGAERLLRRTRPGASVEDPGSFTVAAAAADRITALAQKHPGLVARVENARRQSAAKGEDVEAARRGLDALAEAVGHDLLETVLSEFPPALDADLPRAHDDLTGTDARIAALLAEAGWAGEEPETLLKSAAPGRSEVKAHLKRFDDLEDERRERRRARSRARTELDKADGRLEALRAGDNPPSAADLAAARAERDGLWRRVRAGGADGSALTAYEAALEAADALADRLWQNAERVAERYQLEGSVRDRTLELDRIDEELADLDRVQDALEQGWEELWPSEALPAPQVGAAEDVLDRLDRLRALHSERTARHAELERLVETADTLIDQLASLLTGAGVALEPLAAQAGAGVGRSVALLPQLRELADGELAERRGAAEDRAAALLRVESAERDLARLLDDQTEAEAALSEWERQWAEAVEPAGFAPSAAPESVQADLDRLADVAELLERARGSELRAEELRAEVSAFGERLEAAFAECGVEPPDGWAERSVALEALEQRVLANIEAVRRRAELTGNIRGREEALREARAEEESTEEALGALLAETGVPDTAGLRAAIGRADEAASLRRQIAHDEKQLAVHGAIPALEEQADGLTEPDLDNHLEEVGRRVEELEGRRDAANEERTRAKAELDRIDGSAEAAAASDELAAVRAEITDRAEEYVRLTIAREVLLRCVEAYRRENQDPILRRAEGFFRSLTLGRFTELRPELDDGGRNVLRVVRDTGAQEEVSALSEGTGDQLYLALRLASLERYAVSGQAMPFIVDDIFMTFDDERSAAGLAVLDELAEQFQVVVLTHHRHIAELAESALPRGRAHVHRLPRFAPPSRAEPEPAAGPLPEAADRPSPPALTCRDCGAGFTHTGRGRRPVRCPDCRAGAS